MLCLVLGSGWSFQEGFEGVAIGASGEHGGAIASAGSVQAYSTSRDVLRFPLEVLGSVALRCSINLLSVTNYI